MATYFVKQVSGYKTQSDIPAPVGSPPNTITINSREALETALNAIVADGGTITNVMPYGSDGYTVIYTKP